MKTKLKSAVSIAILLCAGASQAFAQAQKPAREETTGPYVFAYFKEPGSQGIYLALSTDGFTFTPLNDGLPWIKPAQPGAIMRDIFITREPDGHGFRAVWTWNWKGNSLGTAESPDLMNWGPLREIPIMAAFPGVRNTWAPETYWDAQRHDWLILWSSSFQDASAGPEGLRLWSAHTADFTAFSKPELFFDRDFPAIDATLFHRDLHGKHDVVLVLKDQTPDPLRYSERWASGPTVDGPWGPLSGPINESWSEGPSVLQVGEQAVVYYDHYRQPKARYEGVATTDWIHWTSVNDQMHFPEAAKHGSFFRITPGEAQRLLTRHDAAAPAPATEPQ